ncbi:2-keto-4-pentenoate hydratase [Crenalkalicoccus roseus]|uniref:2-keto-4-pentenoate hydratase n=1 Tax=Crenalkalicoccus roseus TaxID=1485588 RepID=UPI00107FD4ED|nr:fumarylacetoacetate hydrolase family protein [Crenalkalicoccus roseus]
MTPAARETLARMLAAARRERRQVASLPAELVPADADEAYAVQDRVAALLGWAPLGWKVAGTNPEMRRRLRMPEPILGRSFAPFLHPSPARLRHAGLLDPIVEAEILFRLGADLPPRGAPWTRAEVAGAVAAIHAGIEVAECRFPMAALPPPTAILADGSASGRYVPGPEIPPGTDLAALPVTVAVDGRVRRTGLGAEVMGDPLLSVVWLANRRNALGDGLRAGEWVSSGTCTGMLLPRPGETVTARFGEAGVVEVAFD